VSGNGGVPPYGSSPLKHLIIRRAGRKEFHWKGIGKKKKTPGVWVRKARGGKMCGGVVPLKAVRATKSRP